MTRNMNRPTKFVVGFLLIAFAAVAMPPVVRADDAPTKENVIKAEEELSKAMRTNDAGLFCRLVDPDWAVINGIGGIGDSVGIRDEICAAIRSGEFTRKTYESDLDHARVRLYGNVAIVTYKLSLSGTFNHRDFSVKEVETDVLNWEDGAWKCVLTHETNVEGTLVMGPPPPSPGN
jgi:ketosteroid isomerase-like protein